MPDLNWGRLELNSLEYVFAGDCICYLSWEFDLDFIVHSWISAVLGLHTVYGVWNWGGELLLWILPLFNAFFIRNIDIHCAYHFGYLPPYSFDHESCVCTWYIDLNMYTFIAPDNDCNWNRSNHKSEAGKGTCLLCHRSRRGKPASPGPLYKTHWGCNIVVPSALWCLSGQIKMLLIYAPSYRKESTCST